MLKLIADGEELSSEDLDELVPTKANDEKIKSVGQSDGYWLSERSGPLYPKELNVAAVMPHTVENDNKVMIKRRFVTVRKS